LHQAHCSDALDIPVAFVAFAFLAMAPSTKSDGLHMSQMKGDSWPDDDLRFLDLLDGTDDEGAAGSDDGSSICYWGRNIPPTLATKDPPTGPLKWNLKCSAQLQKVADEICIGEVLHLDFSFAVADPSHADCPLVACSSGFSELTGYSVQEIVGRNCRFLLDGVPPELIDHATRIRTRAYCNAAVEGYVAQDLSAMPEGLTDVQKPWSNLTEGEIISVQTNAKKSGELFRNMFYLKQVELDDHIYILALQAGLPDEFLDQGDQTLTDLERWCQQAFHRLDERMTAVEHLLAQQFWYCAPMRRQGVSLPA